MFYSPNVGGEIRLVDLLASVLDSIQFRGTVYCQTEFTAPWGVKWEGRPGRAGFFMVVRGGCYLQADQFSDPVPLAAGDFVMSPRSRPYILSDFPSSSVVRFDDVLGDGAPSCHRVVQHGGGGSQTKLVMGCFELDMSENNPFLRSLPEFIHVRAEDLQAEPWLDTTLRFLASECATGKAGSSFAIGRLTDLLFIQSIRVYVAQEMQRPNSSGWLRAMADPQVGQSLFLIHEKPSAPWTVASLASAVGMSRSSFAVRFSELTQSTPLDYLTEWRMQEAQRLLGQSSKLLSEIASSVGYGSEAAFSKAFKRSTGQSPGHFRKGRQLVS